MKRGAKWYVIAAVDRAEEESVFWNNRDGWGALASATVFSPFEKADYHLPLHAAACWMELPEVPE